MIRFRLVHDHPGEFNVKRMCDLVEVPRLSFYVWRNRKPSARDVADAELLVVIRDTHDRSRSTYEVLRVYGLLRRRGHRAARSRVRRIVHANDLVGAHSPRKWRRARPDVGGPPDLTNRNFAASAPDQRWVAETKWVRRLSVTPIGRKMLPAPIFGNPTGLLSVSISRCRFCGSSDVKPSS